MQAKQKRPRIVMKEEYMLEEILTDLSILSKNLDIYNLIITKAKMHTHKYEEYLCYSIKFSVTRMRGVHYTFIERVKRCRECEDPSVISETISLDAKANPDKKIIQFKARVMIDA